MIGFINSIGYIIQADRCRIGCLKIDPCHRIRCIILFITDLIISDTDDLIIAECKRKSDDMMDSAIGTTESIVVIPSIFSWKARMSAVVLTE